MEVVNYEGGESIKFSLNKCPLCKKKHEYDFIITEVEILYCADAAAYRPRERHIILTCPTNGDYFKIIFRVHYPYHSSYITSVSVDGLQLQSPMPGTNLEEFSEKKRPVGFFSRFFRRRTD